MAEPRPSIAVQEPLAKRWGIPLPFRTHTVPSAPIPMSMASPATTSHVVPFQRKIVLASFTTQAAPWGSTAIRIAPPGILSQAVPFHRWMVKPPGTGWVPMAQSTPFAPRPTSVAFPSRGARLEAWAEAPAAAARTRRNPMIIRRI
jgi:hypothetical protein